jgi:hypothetical protein
MSASQRLVPLLLVAFVGVVSGVYIFDGPLKQYRSDTDGSFKPDKAVPHLTPSSVKEALDASPTQSQNQQAIAEARAAPVQKEIARSVKEAKEELKAKMEKLV